MPSPVFTTSAHSQSIFFMALLSKITLLSFFGSPFLVSARPHIASPHVGRALLPSSGWTYVGCFGEPSGGRILATRVLSSDSLTLESCTSACGAAGYTYAGAEYGRVSWPCFREDDSVDIEMFRQECWCGNTLNQPVTKGDSSCIASCSGMKSSCLTSYFKLTISPDRRLH